MATKVYDEIELELSNGETISVRPLQIKPLRKFMEVIKKLDSEDIQDETQAMDVFIEACMVCMEKIKPELSKDRDLFEEIIEVPTMMKILEVSGGLKLNDPNLLGAALVGTN